jgi:hypothetical protein
MSALYTLFCIVHFDGQKLASEPTPVSCQTFSMPNAYINIDKGILNSQWNLLMQETIIKFKENMLYEMMSIDDNKGQVPSIFIATVDD